MESECKVVESGQVEGKRSKLRAAEVAPNKKHLARLLQGPYRLLFNQYVAEKPQ